MEDPQIDMEATLVEEDHLMEEDCLMEENPPNDGGPPGASRELPGCPDGGGLLDH